MGRKGEDGFIYPCPCCLSCKHSNEFQKVLDLKDTGLIVYRHVRNENTKPKTELEFTFTYGDEDIFIFHNTKNDKINPADHTIATLDKEKINCPRCKVLYERAEKLLCRVPVMDRHEIIGICDHCLSKQRPCCKCTGIVKKFTTSTYKKQQEESKRVKEWLTKIRQLLANIMLKKEESRKLKNRAYSDVTIDKLWKKSLHEQELGKVFQSEIDRAHIVREPERSLSKGHPTSEFTGSHLHATQTFKSYSTENILDLQNHKGNNRVRIRNKLPDEDFLEKLKTNTRKRQLFIKEASLNDFFQKDKQYFDRSRHSVSETSVIFDIARQTLKSSLKKQEKGHKKSKENFSTSIPRWQSESDLYSRTKPTKTNLITEDFIYHFPKEVHSKKKIPLDDILSSTELIKETREILKARDELIKLKQEDRKRLNAEKQKKVAETRKKLEEKRELEEKNKQELQLKREQGSGREQIQMANETKKDIDEHDNNETKPAKNSMIIGKDIKKFTKLRDETKISDKLKEEKKEEKEHNEFKVIKEKEVTQPKTIKKGQEKGKSEIKHLKGIIDKQPKIEFGQTKEKEKPLKEKPLKREKKMLKDEIDFPSEKSLRNVPEIKKDEKKPVHSPKRDQVSQLKIKKEEKLMSQPQKEKESKSDPVKNDTYLEKEESEKKKEHQENNRLKENLEEKTLQKPKQIEKEDNLGELHRSKLETQKQLEKEEKIEGKQSQRVGKLKQLEEIPLSKLKKEKEETIKEEPKEAEQKKKKDEDYAMAELKKKLAQETKQKEEELKVQKQMEQQKKQIQQESDKKAREEAQLALKKMREAKPEPVTATETPKVEKPVEKSKIKELNIKQIKVYNPSEDDLILRLVTIRQSQKREVKTKPKTLSDIPKVIINSHKAHKHKKIATCIICRDSNLELDAEFNANKESEEKDMIKGQKIYKYNPSIFEPKKDKELVPMLFKSEFNDDHVKILVKEKHADVCDEADVHDIQATTRKPMMADQDTKGIIHYALSDRAFIEKGWTMLPTEKVVRKMNVYRMRPAHPEFDWFAHNKNRREMQYDSGEKLAEIDDNGRGRWFYRNGRLALDYYDAEEINAQQRFVVYSSGEPDERGRTHPITILATFDYLGNGIVFDHAGKIRLKYNQTEGVILDRGIGPVSHWKWHTLNDPPVLQQVMIDTQVAIKDPQILQLGNPTEDKTRPDNEEMLAIEFDNFIKEKSKKLSQKFKPFQIKMKALKINEHFSLRVLDQATIYLIFRDGTTNLKLNIGMILDHKEIVDTDTAEVGEVSNNVERLPARTDSLAGLQRSVAHAQRVERSRLERERRLRHPVPSASADRLAAAAGRASRPLPRHPVRTTPSSGEVSTTDGFCVCRKTSSNLYYDTRLI